MTTLRERQLIEENQKLRSEVLDLKARLTAYRPSPHPYEEHDYDLGKMAISVDRIGMMAYAKWGATVVPREGLRAWLKTADGGQLFMRHEEFPATIESRIQILDDVMERFQEHLWKTLQGEK